MSAQRVIVTRTGGFAGVRRTAEVDDPDEAERLSAAVRRSAEREGDARVRDDFTYEFVVVTSTSTETYDLSGAQLTEELRRQVRAVVGRTNPG